MSLKIKTEEGIQKKIKTEEGIQIKIKTEEGIQKRKIKTEEGIQRKIKTEEGIQKRKKTTTTEDIQKWVNRNKTIPNSRNIASFLGADRESIETLIYENKYSFYDVKIGKINYYFIKKNNFSIISSFLKEQHQKGNCLSRDRMIEKLKYHFWPFKNKTIRKTLNECKICGRPDLSKYLKSLIKQEQSFIKVQPNLVDINNISDIKLLIIPKLENNIFFLQIINFYTKTVIYINFYEEDDQEIPIKEEEEEEEIPTQKLTYMDDNEFYQNIIEKTGVVQVININFKSTKKKDDTLFLLCHHFEHLYLNYNIFKNFFLYYETYYDLNNLYKKYEKINKII
ncbi:expressed protein [Dictyostelium purpureum]|uniref:Expressed protein n=1 Tax=Dictyostelium purpureum TaxID=5786 RepID=F0ZQC6_DICPU|nr:uncharacterized protein DICPUDRAFT_98437 [Dictyostelium purpureum]EGC33882.1 expressed protein [Dictyostelium purpureum]|eukprot:XP_003289620.1 expressed protein [Dictyostelium purpureum]